MSETRYWKLKKGSEADTVARDLILTRETAKKRQHALAEELGAEGPIVQGERMIGVKFSPKAKPDKKVWKPIRGYEDDHYYSPRCSSRDGKALKARMDAIKCPGGNSLADALGPGMQLITGEGLGFMTCGLGCEEFGDTLYISGHAKGKWKFKVKGVIDIKPSQYHMAKEKHESVAA